MGSITFRTPPGRRHECPNQPSKTCNKVEFPNLPLLPVSMSLEFPNAVVLNVVVHLVTRIAATSKSQIASDCNRNSKKSLRLRKHPLKPTLWTRESPVLCGFYSVSEAPHGSGHPRNTLRLQGCDSESQRFFWPNAIFVIATLRFYCDFCGKSLRLRSCGCQSLAICDCDCVGH